MSLLCREDFVYIIYARLSISAGLIYSANQLPGIDKKGIIPRVSTYFPQIAQKNYYTGIDMNLAVATLNKRILH